MTGSGRPGHVMLSEPTPPRGLDESEAARRLAADGPNTLARDATRRLSALILEVVREPMLTLLLACATLYLALGDVHEGLILLGCVLLVVTTTILQARRTDRAVAALRDLSSPRALVIRGGVERRIAGAEVVRGDLVRLHEGDRVPADGALIAATSLAADESLLTGESVPVAKAAGERVFAGSLVVRGHGVAEISATGRRSELGKIGVSLATVESAPPRIQGEVTRLVRVLGVAGGVCCLVVFVVLGVGRGGWLEALLAGLTLAMSLLPEELPVVLTVFLALGAWRMSRQRVLVRRVPALESLGGATVLCVDKTGTLTHNRMALVVLHADNTVWSADRAGALPAALHALARHAALASRRETFDPMDDACRRFAGEHLADPTAGGTLVREYTLTPALLAVSHVWRGLADARLVATKGAPEAVARLCGCDDVTLAAIRRDVAAMTGTGLRVLGVASGELPGDATPDDQTGLPLRWLGLVGLQDPPRAEVRAALARCREAGIRVLMITGDDPGTARAIGAAVGLPDARPLIGAELAALDDAALRARLRGTSICARVLPDQKLRIVRALQTDGEVVAMTGDGINDAPALKAAQVGVAMGGRGTDVAREAAAVVLTRDDFTDLVAAIAEGRRIFANLGKAFGFIVAVHVPIAGIALVPLLFGLPMLLQPVHVVLLELIIDPACSVVFEAEAADPDLMRRPPRSQSVPLLDRETLVRCTLRGLCVLAVCLAALYYSHIHRGQSIAVAQSLMFSTLVLADLGLILVHRSSTSVVDALRRPNAALRWVLVGSVLVLMAALEVPVIRDLLRFAPVPGLQLLAWGLLGPASVLWFERFGRSPAREV